MYCTIAHVQKPRKRVSTAVFNHLADNAKRIANTCSIYVCTSTTM